MDENQCAEVVEIQSITKQEKQILTLHFTVGLVDDIDDFIYTAKKELPARRKRKLNRTTLLQLILEEVMDDFSKFREDSFLWKLISAIEENN